MSLWTDPSQPCKTAAVSDIYETGDRPAHRSCEIIDEIIDPSFSSLYTQVSL